MIIATTMTAKGRRRGRGRKREEPRAPRRWPDRFSRSLLFILGWVSDAAVFDRRG